MICNSLRRGCCSTTRFIAGRAMALTKAMTGPQGARHDAQPGPSLTRTFARIGCLSFGGPAAQIALMHRVVLDEKLGR